MLMEVAGNMQLMRCDTLQGLMWPVYCVSVRSDMCVAAHRRRTA